MGPLHDNWSKALRQNHTVVSILIASKSRAASHARAVSSSYYYYSLTIPVARVAFQSNPYSVSSVQQSLFNLPDSHTRAPPRHPDACFRIPEAAGPYRKNYVWATEKRSHRHSIRPPTTCFPQLRAITSIAPKQQNPGALDSSRHRGEQCKQVHT